MPSAVDEVPEPVGPPLAADAPPQLVSFLYAMLRDVVPVGYVDACLSRALGGNVRMDANPELKEYADRVARALSYDGSSASP